MSILNAAQTRIQAEMTKRLIALIMAKLLLISGCGPLEVRSIPPGLSLESISTLDQQVLVHVLVENRNDHVIRLQSVRLRMMLDDTALFEHASPTALEIDPRGRELLQMRLNAQFEGLDRLNSIETSQAYRLEGELQFEALRDYPVRLRGFLHPVPGQPGRYR